MPFLLKPYKTTVDLERVSQLPPDWKRAWNGIYYACLAVKLIIPVYVLRELVILYLTVQSGQEYRYLLVPTYRVLLILQLLLIFLHLIGQFKCISIPENYGAWTAEKSCYLSTAAIGVVVLVILQTFFLTDLPHLVRLPVLILVFLWPLLIVYSWWFWVGFLKKLGSGLGHNELPVVARIFRMWLWVVFLLQMIASIQGRVLIETEPFRNKWFLNSLAGLVTAIALLTYHRLLQRVLISVSRRGPVNSIETISLRTTTSDSQS